MLQGKVRAAVRWLSRGGVLSPSDVVDVKGVNGDVIQSSVWEILCKKHPEPVVPDKDSLIECESLPQFEEIEINGSHVLKVARMIQVLVGVIPVIGRIHWCILVHIVSGCGSLLQL